MASKVEEQAMRQETEAAFIYKIEKARKELLPKEPALGTHFRLLTSRIAGYELCFAKPLNLW